MIFCSAYAAMVGVLPALVTADTAIVSDELNHNCIINAIEARTAEDEGGVPAPRPGGARPRAGLADRRHAAASLVVTDGVFSMRGDHAPLDASSRCWRAHDERFAENAVLIVDDSHGVGAFGAGGRGTEEVTGGQADVLVATLGKALGVNGGYVVGSQTLIDYLRETSPTYIYSNPITPAEAAAALAARRAARQRRRHRVVGPAARQRHSVPGRDRRDWATRRFPAYTRSCRCSSGTPSRPTSSSPTCSPMACSPRG